MTTLNLFEIIHRRPTFSDKKETEWQEALVRASVLYDQISKLKALPKSTHKELRAIALDKELKRTKKALNDLVSNPEQITVAFIEDYPATQIPTTEYCDIEKETKLSYSLPPEPLSLVTHPAYNHDTNEPFRIYKDGKGAYHKVIPSPDNAPHSRLLITYSDDHDQGNNT